MFIFFIIPIVTGVFHNTTSHVDNSNQKNVYYYFNETKPCPQDFTSTSCFYSCQQHFTSFEESHLVWNGEGCWCKDIGLLCGKCPGYQSERTITLEITMNGHTERYYEHTICEAPSTTTTSFTNTTTTTTTMTTSTTSKSLKKSKLQIHLMWSMILIFPCSIIFYYIYLLCRKQKKNY